LAKVKPLAYPAHSTGARQNPIDPGPWGFHLISERNTKSEQLIVYRRDEQLEKRPSDFRMNSSRFRFPAIILISVFLLPGCGDEATNVGIGLIDIQAGEPEVALLDASIFESSPEPDVTGGPLFTEDESGAARVLAGHVEDPALGSITAVGHVDFVQSSSLSDDFKNGRVSSVELKLYLDYTYGDTLSPLTLRLFEQTGDWTATGSRADAVLTAGSPIVEFSFMPVPGTVSVGLPTSWVDTIESNFRRDDAGELFHGFQIQFVDGNAVAGFSQTRSILRVAVPGDTVSFQITELFSTLTGNPLPVPSEYILLQDGSGAAVDLTFDLTGEDLADSAVHRSIIRVNTATPDLITPTGFVRPQLSSVLLIAITGDEERRVPIVSGLFEDDGRVSFENEALNTAIQNIVKGIGGWRRFEVAAPVSENSLDVLFLQRSGENGPRALLTVTRVN